MPGPRTPSLRQVSWHCRFSIIPSFKRLRQEARVPRLVWATQSYPIPNKIKLARKSCDFVLCGGKPLCSTTLLFCNRYWYKTMLIMIVHFCYCDTEELEGGRICCDPHSLKDIVNRSGESMAARGGKSWLCSAIVKNWEQKRYGDRLQRTIPKDSMTTARLHLLKVLQLFKYHHQLGNFVF